MCTGVVRSCLDLLGKSGYGVEDMVEDRALMRSSMSRVMEYDR